MQIIAGEQYKDRFCNNSEINTLILKQLSVKNKAKLCQLETQNIFPGESVALFSTDNRF